MSGASKASSNRGTRLEFRLLSGIMLDKEVAVPETLQGKLANDNARKVFKIVEALFDDPEKISTVNIVIDNPNIINQSKKQLDHEDLNSDPNFDKSKVKKFSDLPGPWVWGWVRQQCQHPPEQDMIDKISKHSTVQIRNIRIFCTGLPDCLLLPDGLMEKQVCADYMTQCFKNRGSPLNFGSSGFFGNAISDKGEVLFVGSAGVYHFKPDPDRESNVKMVVHGPSKEEVDIQAKFPETTVPMTITIKKNHDEFAAHVLVMSAPILLHTLFPNMVKPKAKDLAIDIDTFLDEISSKQGKGKVTVDAQLMQASKRRRKSMPSAVPLAATEHSST